MVRRSSDWAREQIADPVLAVERNPRQVSEILAAMFQAQLGTETEVPFGLADRLTTEATRFPTPVLVIDVPSASRVVALRATLFAPRSASVQLEQVERAVDRGIRSCWQLQRRKCCYCSAPPPGKCDRNSGISAKQRDQR